ncbi:MAG: carboxymuconolactone decarboxylase family protein [Betaproteobacteria bacterium]|nr:carboxymuconolactone decarboxylase family protein [Betaproteobacteria bacterium]
MTHLTMTPTEPEDPALKAMFDEVRARGIEVPNLYRVLGIAPQMFRAWLDFAWPLRLHAKTPRGLRELLILRGAQISGANYEWAHHVGMALAAGITQAQIDALRDALRDALPTVPDSALFSTAQKAVIRLAEEVTRGPGASKACIELLKHSFTDAEIVELVLTASFYVCVSRFLQSMDVGLEPGFEAHGPGGKD